MPKYLVEINGRNFLIDMDGRVARFGFFTNRSVDASDVAAAELAAVGMIRATQRLREVVRNPPADPPSIDVTQIDALEASDEADEGEPGFIWYEENPRRWWQFWKSPPRPG